jgi:hypothetical protein
VGGVNLSSFADAEWWFRPGSDVDDTIPGPSVAAVAQVPHRSIPPEPYRASGLLRTLCAYLVFWSGNIQAPSRFGDAGRLEEFLDTKEFRGVLAVDAVTLDLFKGSPVRLGFRLLRRPGFTAPPVPPPLRVAQFGYSAGEVLASSADVSWHCRLLPAGGGVRLEVTLRFRIGRPSRAVGRMLTGLDAPYVTMTLWYEFHTDSSVWVHSTGSAIPSVLTYWPSDATERDWLRGRHQDMTGITTASWDAFLDSARDYGQMAPIHYTWNETIRQGLTSGASAALRPTGPMGR